MMMMNVNIRQLIDDEDLQSIFTTANGGGTFLKTVDYERGAPETDNFGGHYQIYLSSKIPKNAQLICLFPNRNNPRASILQASRYNYLSSFNKDINAALLKSMEHTSIGQYTKFAVAYGEHVYACKCLTGTVYIVWASHVSRVNVGNVANTIGKSVPLIVNLDGQRHIKSIFMLKHAIQHASELDLLPNGKTALKVLIPREPIFVCESHVVEQPKYTIEAVSEMEALSAITAETKNPIQWLSRERNVFQLSDEEVQWNSVSYSMRDVVATPLQFERDDDDEELEAVETFISDHLNEPDPFTE